MQLPSRFSPLGACLACVVLAGACANAGTLAADDDDEGIGRPIGDDDDDDASPDARAPRADASSSGAPSSSSGGSGSSSGGASSSSGGPDAGPLTACQQALAGILFDVEGGTGLDWKVGVNDGFTTTATDWPYQPWFYSSPGDAVIPTGCAAGQCIGTSLTQNYAQCQRGWAATPPADLSACAGKNVVVKLDHAYDFVSVGGGFKDGGIVQMTGNGDDFADNTWTTLDSGDLPGIVHPRGTLSSSYKCNAPDSFFVDGKPGYVGTQAATQTATLPVPQSALTANARVRFVFASGVAFETTNADQSRQHTAFGWRIDNVRFEEP